MNKTIICVVLILVFISCRKNHSNFNNSDISAQDCKACEYLPTCTNINYVYQDQLTISGTNSTIRTLTHLFEGDTTIEGMVFQKIATLNGTTYQKCNNGITTSITYNSTLNKLGNAVTKIELVPLKSNGAIGTSWTDHITNIQDQDVKYDYSIVEKGISRTVLGVNFNNVIHVNVADSINYSGTDYVSAGKTDYYYAKGIGMIESVNKTAGYIISSTYLKSYSINN